MSSVPVFPTLLQEVVYKRTYSRWRYDLQRREDFTESVDRYIDFMISAVNKKKFTDGAKRLLSEKLEMARIAMKSLDVVGSMRALWTAGEALEREPACGFNCWYTTIESLKDFSDIFYLLLCGGGVSYSNERQVIASLPIIPEIVRNTDITVVFEDSKEGWAKGYFEFITYLSKGIYPSFDLSKIRPKGAILKVFGGRASGPGPLKELLLYTVRSLEPSRGRKMTSEVVADIVCKIADTVVVGGTRRSATLALTNPSDRRMAEYKKGEWWVGHGERALVNVSSCYTEKPEPLLYLEDMMHLIESKSGERGIINRESMLKTMVEQGRLKEGEQCNIGVNPCSEIILKPRQACNLSEIVVREDDTLETLTKKAEIATVLGFVQSLLVDFNFLSEEWKKNAEEDRLLGVSMTGLRDHPVLGEVSPYSEFILSTLREECHRVEETLANACGIAPSKALTCNKPSGTASLVLNTASGLHVRYSPFYIRRMRIAAGDPLAKLLIDQGLHHDPENGETVDNVRTWVFSFPIAAPKGAKTKKDVTAIEQLEYWKMLKTKWCDHNPSCTVYVKEKEWVDVVAWTYSNFDLIGGVSFLPDDNTYTLAPFEEITENEYNELMAKLPAIDLSKLNEYEHEDYTIGSSEVACTGGACEL